MRCHICNSNLTILKSHKTTKKIEPCDNCIEASKEIVYDPCSFEDFSEEDLEILSEPLAPLPEGSPLEAP